MKKTSILACILVIYSLSLSAQAVLPYNYDLIAIPTGTGITSSGLSTYATSPAIKFGVAGNYLILNFTGTPGTLTFNLKWNQSTSVARFPGTFALQESVDGILYTNVQLFDATNGPALVNGVITPITINTLQSSTRFLKWIYTTKSNGNIGLGLISLTAGSIPNTLALTTQAAASVASTTATLNGTISSFDAGSAFVNSYGFCWNTTGTPTITDSKVDKGFSSTTGAYSHSVSNLSPFTTYYVRSYATNGSGVTSYGGQVSFTTTTGLAAVSTQAATSVISTGATLNATISSLGDTPVTAHGFCWNTTGAPTIANLKTDLGVRNTTGSITYNISSLSSNTTYYVRSYVTNNAGTTYGSEINFNTALGVGSVTTEQPSSVTLTTATLNGTIASLGDSPVSAYGFCWNTIGAPTLSDTKIDKGSTSSIGAFTQYVSVFTANTTYYVRSFVTNSFGTVYGNEISFTNNIPTISTSQTQLSGFNYKEGNGPSGSKTISFSSVNTTGLLTVTAPANFEISNDGVNFYSSNTYISDGGLASTTLYVRLISGLVIGSYSGNLTFSVSGAANVIVPLSGSVTLTQINNIIQLSAGSDVAAVLNLAQEGDIIELTSSGGSYNWSTQVTVSTEKTIVIRAAAGLASRPLITFTGATSSTIAFIRYYPTTGVSIKTLTLDGISFDGIGGMGYLLYMRCPTITSNVNVVMNNCVVKNLYLTNGRVFNYIGTGGVTPTVYGDLTVTNSEFRMFGSSVINATILYNCPNNVSFSNCYFESQVPTSNATIRMSATGYNSLSINHCTFNRNLNNAEISVVPSIGTSSITNSIFANNGTVTNVNSFGGARPIILGSDCGVYYTGTGVKTSIYPNSTAALSTDPVLDMSGVATAPAYLTGSTDGKPIGYYNNFVAVLTVSTKSTTNLTSTTATLNGSINSFDPNIAFVTAYGFCWNATGTPTIADSKVDKGFSSTSGAYSYSISNLSPFSTYYVRAYATNSNGTTYGGEMTFTTTTGIPTVGTQAASSITYTTAILNGTVISLGDTPVSSHGFCWSTSTSPTIANSKTDLGALAITGSITSNISSLLPSTTYYVRSYASNNAGTTYGNEVSFTTTTGLGAVSTQAATSIISIASTLNGTINSMGDSPVTSYGFCWNTTGSPTLTDSKIDKGATSSIGAYTHNLTSLTPNTTYYVRSYIINSSGTSYGSEISFTTPSGLVVVNTKIATTVTGTTAVLNATVSELGDTPVTSYGFCWSTTGTPTIADIKIDKGALYVTGVYSHNMTNLEMGKVYYVRAYATNSVGTSYGSLQAFQTLGVVFNVTVPAGTNECWIAGNFNNWTQNQQKMSKIDATHYSVTVDETTFPAGVTKSNIEYKYLSGPVWIYVEKDAAGMEMINRSYSTSDVVANWAITYVPNVPAVPQKITFNALVPDNTQVCFLLGTFNSWANPTDSTLMTRGIPSNGQVLFTKTITVPDINTLQFRFTAGPDWTYEQSNPTANFSYTGQSMQSIVYSFKSVYQIVLPAAAGTITGSTSVCPGQTAVTYTVPVIADATSYIWTLPTGASTISTGNSISVDYSNSATSGNVKVYGRNMFGVGAESTLAVTVNPLPSTAGTITGASTVCQGQSSVVYTVSPIANATGYVWALPTGMTGTSTTNTITVDYSNTAVSGNITVQGSNGCGVGTASSLAITVNSIPVNTGTITGATTVCLGQSSVVYSTSAIANATSYEWTLPTGATGTSATNSITVDYSNLAVSGNITVKGVNDCGKSAATTLHITVSQPIGAIGTISGATTVCQAENGLLYSVPAVDNATSYSWLLPTGASGTSTTNSITVNFGNSAQSGDIIVRASNGCSNTQFASMSVTVHQKPATPVITVLYNNGYYLHSSAATGNQWYNASGLINGATAQDYNFPVNDTYYVYVNNGSCTSDVSNSIVMNTTLLSAANALDNIKLYPNPVRNELHIDLESETKIEIINLMGSVIYSARLNKNTIIETSTMLSGVYLLKIERGNKVDYRKFVKE